MKLVSDYIEFSLYDKHKDFLEKVNLKPGMEIWSKTTALKGFRFLLTEEMIKSGYWAVEDVGTYDPEHCLVFRFERPETSEEEKIRLQNQSSIENYERIQYERLKKKFEGSQ
jgi:hypothetical protein